MLLRLSAPGKMRLFQSQELETNFVGAEANAGVTLSRLGNTVDMVTVVPDNTVGRACEDALHAQGINTKYVQKHGPRLAVYYLETGALIRPSVITYDRANSSFALAPTNLFDWDQILDGADFLHVCGISLAVSESSYQSCLNAVQAARQHGVKVSFDCNYRAALWKGRESRANVQIREIVGYANVLFGGPRDANLLLNAGISSADPEIAFQQAASAFLDAFPGLETVAATNRTVRSSDSNDLSGLISNRTQLSQSQSFNLDGIVDRIGGGDAFAGGVLHKLAQNASLEDTIAFGTAASAVKHSISGDFNLTSESEVEALAQNTCLDVKR